MFFETTYNQRGFGGLGKTDTEAEVKAAVAACLPQWKAAGRPQDKNFCSTIPTKPGKGGLTPHPLPVTTLPAPGMPGTADGGGLQTPAGEASNAGGDSGFSLSSLVSNIPPTLLYVGGAVMVFMLIKRR
jgi:hypothetical protein